jgi:hypothetical protein
VVLRLLGAPALARTASGTAVFGLLPVVPTVLVSGLLMAAVSLATRRPTAATLARYFPSSA